MTLYFFSLNDSVNFSINAENTENAENAENVFAPSETLSFEFSIEEIIKKAHNVFFSDLSLRFAVYYAEGHKFILRQQNVVSIQVDGNTIDLTMLPSIRAVYIGQKYQTKFLSELGKYKPKLTFSQSSKDLLKAIEEIESLLKNNSINYLVIL